MLGLERTNEPSTVSRGTLARLRVPRCSISDDALHVLLSAMSRSQSVATLEFPSTVKRLGELETQALTPLDCAWLGFALFHPDAETSSWCSLSLSVPEFSDENAAVLERMAQGNNLLAFLQSDDGAASFRCAAYHVAHARAGAVVRVRPDERALVLVHLEDDSVIDVCVESASAPTIPSWFFVVIPGVGGGWLSSSCVDRVDARPPCSTRLRSLTVRLSHDVSVCPQSICSAVAALGAGLEHLDIGRCGAVESASQLRTLLCATPRLVSLSVAHTGTLWTSEEQQQQEQIDSQEGRTLPSLRELELVLSQNYVFEPPSPAELPKLQALRLTTSSSASLERNLPAMRALLATHPQLTRLHWLNVHTQQRRKHRALPQYDEVRDASHRLVTQCASLSTGCAIWVVDPTLHTSEGKHCIL